MEYIKLDENNVPVISTIRRKPDWRKASGDLLTDAELRESHGLYPLVQDRPETNPVTEYYQRRPVEDWHVTDEKVVATFDIKKHDLVKIKERLRELVADLRWRIEVGGVYCRVTGNDENDLPVKIDTSRDGRAALLEEKEAAVNGERKDGELWKTLGGFKSLDNSQIVEAWKAARKMRKQSFEREKALLDKIESLESAQEAEDFLDNDVTYGWPENALEEAKIKEA